MQAATRRALGAADPDDKVTLTGRLAEDWRNGLLALEDSPAPPPDRPARPPTPVLKPPREMPRRRNAGAVKNRIALLHAVAHIELNAIDLANDMVCRFAGAGLPREFVDDWTRVAADEARHFVMIRGRLRAEGADYGDLAAHDGLWRAAVDTRGDVLARLAIVPLVLEARGLDVTPGMADRLRRAGDDNSADLLETIFEDEISHVRAGKKWFDFVCGGRGLDPEKTFQKLVRRYFPGPLKAPFNVAARRRAGMEPPLYHPLTGNSVYFSNG